MGPSATDVVELHTAISPAAELVDRRRATYQAAVRLASGAGATGDVPLAVVDNPMVRGHLADVLAGVAELDPSRLTSVDEMVVATSTDRVRMAAAPAAATVLAPAVARIGAELARRGASGLDGVVLDATSPAWASAEHTFRDGVALARRVAPALTDDLLGHVALVALLDRGRVAPLGSASAREYPGLIMLPAPETAVEAAEAVIHESAHQKFFDLAIVGSLFAPDYHRAPLFDPPWAAAGSVGWPFEQTVAACHAYFCLAAFWARCRSHDLTLHDYSLLPVAAQRATALADWILERMRFLGNDGRRLVGGLADRQITLSRQMVTPRATAPGTAAPVDVRRCGSWELSMRWGRPVEIIWRQVVATDVTR